MSDFLIVWTPADRNTDEALFVQQKKMPTLPHFSQWAPQALIKHHSSIQLLIYMQLWYAISYVWHGMLCYVHGMVFFFSCSKFCKWFCARQRVNPTWCRSFSWPLAAIHVALAGIPSPKQSNTGSLFRVPMIENLYFLTSQNVFFLHGLYPASGARQSKGCGPQPCPDFCRNTATLVSPQCIGDKPIKAVTSHLPSTPSFFPPVGSAHGFPRAEWKVWNPFAFEPTPFTESLAFASICLSHHRM